MAAEEFDEQFEALLLFLKRARGFDFTGYKRPSLVRRVRRRMQALGISNYGDYLDYLEVHADEFTELFNTILINVTRFFRDSDAWSYVGDHAIPRLLTSKEAHEPIRVWSAGCASGEEAYSLAMLFAERLGEDEFRERVKIYATDVDEDALELARQAAFTAKQLEGVPEEYRERYFELANGDVVGFRKDLRRALIFGRHDLVRDAPISRIDLLACRNILMYFNSETQSRILTRFHFALQDTGFLFLGKVEMLLWHSDLFAPAELKHRVFVKVPRPNLRDRLLILSHHQQAEAQPEFVATDRLVEVVFDSSPLAQVIVDAQGFLALSSAKARGWFDISPSDLGRPFQDLELSYRPAELRSSIEQVRTTGTPTRLQDITWSQGTDQLRHLDVELAPVRNRSGGIVAVALAFIDVTRYRRLQDELEHANSELESAYEELQSTNEELETTNEELQSAVEELETTNEELQSTNEELETTNEELQSTNDELQSTNDALGRQTQELDDVNAFLESILESIGGGIIVVDQDLRVQAWNAKSEDLWGLRPGEVQGRNLLTLDIGLPVVDLAAPVRRCVSDPEDRQDVVLDAHDRRGKGFRCRVRCSPLRKSNGEVRGVILMTDEDSA